MRDRMVWVLVSLGILALLVAFFGIFVWNMRKKGWKHETDYKAFFVMGVVWFPLGLLFDMPFFFILGLAYMAIGLANKDKWGKKTPANPKLKKKLMLAMMAGIIALFLGMAIALLFI